MLQVEEQGCWLGAGKWRGSGARRWRGSDVTGGGAEMLAGCWQVEEQWCWQVEEQGCYRWRSRDVGSSLAGGGAMHDGSLLESA
ncbi:hypothetical protein NQZ68_029809 [Dissostichus eleginoides]|nr:hypothetical protein NQZ68_029809 [Dissostichus eleginoides]